MVSLGEEFVKKGLWSEARTKAEISSAVYRHAVEFAKAQGRDEGELLDELIEESVRMREHPGSVSKADPRDGARGLSGPVSTCGR